MDLFELVSKVKTYVYDKPVEGLEHKLEGVQRRLEFLGAAEVARGLFELVEKFSGLGESLQAAATSAGLTVDELQKLQYAGSMAAVSGEEMGTALTHLTRQLYAAKEGGAEAIKAFGDVGISPEQLQGFRTGQDALKALADRFSQIRDPIKKNALAQEMLGRGSAKMVGFLSKGSKAIGEMGKEAQDVGAILSGPQVQALADVEDALSQLWQVFRTFMAGIAASFAPAVQFLVGRFLELYKANRDFLQLNMASWFSNITYAMGFVYGLVEGLSIKFMRFAKTHGELIKWAGYLVLGLMALAVAGALISAAFGGIATVFGAISVLFSPLVLGIGVFILLAQSLWTLLSGGKWTDTWLYKLLSAGGSGLGWLMDKLGIGPGAPKPVINSEGVPTSIARAGENINVLSDMSYAGVRPAPPGAAGAPVAVDMNAPITINVPPGTDPRQVGDAARQGIKEHLDQLSREMRRSLKPAQAY